MVRDLLDRLRSARTWLDVELHTDSPTGGWSPPGIQKHLQAPGNLGQRLSTAIEQGLRSGRPAVLILGSDSPTVPLAHLSELLKTTTDVALGPATDGGFYAILCRRIHSEMFDGVKWSEATTCDQTIHAARRCGLTVALGPQWYDIDTPRDLEALLHDPDLGPATRSVLETAGLLRVTVGREAETNAD